MIAGRLPFRSEYPSVIVYSILNEEPKPLTSIRSNVPLEFENIISKILSKNLSERYQHADEIRVDLTRLNKSLENRGSNLLAELKDKKTGKKKRNSIRLLIIILIFTIVVFFVVIMINFFQSRFPVVILMDSPHPERVYDPETRKNKGTNADDITDVLRDLPIELHKETTSSFWHREDQVLRQNPDLILIHRSCFYDATNLADSSFMLELYKLIESKLVSFLGYIGLGNSRTKFIVYSRSFDKNQSRWIAAVEERFPPLKGRVLTLFIPGGRDSATFRNPKIAANLKSDVKKILGMN